MHAGVFFQESEWNHHKSSRLSLAVHEAQAPVGRQEGPPKDAGCLVQYVHGSWPRKEVHVQDASSCPELHCGWQQHNVHAIAVHDQYAMRFTPCMHAKIRCPVNRRI